MSCARLCAGLGHLELQEAARSCLPHALVGSKTTAGTGPGNSLGCSEQGGGRLRAWPPHL